MTERVGVTIFAYLLIYEVGLVFGCLNDLTMQDVKFDLSVPDNCLFIYFLPCAVQAT